MATARSCPAIGSLPTLKRVAGDGGLSQSCDPCAQDNMSALTPNLAIGAMTVGPDDQLYIGENFTGSIYRIDNAGIMHRIAGTGMPEALVRGPA